MMDDDDDQIEIDSDDEGNRGGFVDKRAHHNALERKRRDHIKESFTGLRDAIPTMQGDKSSRAQILKKASDYISFMRKKNNNHQKDIDDLKRQNTHLEAQIRALEKAKNSGNFSSPQEVLETSGLNFDPVPSSSNSNALASHDSGSSSNGTANDDHLDHNGGPGSEAGYEGSGSDNGEVIPARTTTTTVVQQQHLQIQQISPQQRVIQVVPGGSLRTIAPGQSLLIQPGATVQQQQQQQQQQHQEPLRKKMKN